jgi:hypothetical protein
MDEILAEVSAAICSAAPVSSTEVNDNGDVIESKRAFLARLGSRGLENAVEQGLRVIQA